MNDTETDLELIGGAIDGDGEEVPGEHPIENPGPPDDDVAEDDPLAEPHPDEPGVTPDGDVGENPGDEGPGD